MTFVLGVDLDGVTGDYVRMFRHFVARELDVPEDTLPAPKTWDFSKAGWGVRDQEHYFELHTKAVAAGLFRAMPLMAGASEALWKLSDAGVHVRIITHRLCTKGQHRTAASDTVEWLETNNVPYRDLCFQGDKVAVSADCYIDDAPHNIEALRAAGGYCIAFDAPYNQHIEGPRAANWDEAVDLILARFAAAQADRAAQRESAAGPFELVTT